MSRTRGQTRRALGGVTVAAGVLAVSACGVVETACPAIDYSSVATVTLEQPREGLTLRLCDGADCEPGPANDDVIAIEGDSLHGWTADFIGGQDTIGRRAQVTDVTFCVISARAETRSFLVWAERTAVRHPFPPDEERP